MNMQKKISVVINTYNAERHFARVLESVQGFDEVLVCDMDSTDSTLDIARQHGCRIVNFPKGEHRIVEPAREFAIHEAQCEWVLVVDADELVPVALRDYLYNQIASDGCPDAIAIPRRNYFMGRFLHAAYPDYVLRFFRKDACHWPAIIHSSPQISGTVYRIPQSRKELAFEHLANDDVSSIIHKNNTYSDYEVIRRQHKKYGIGALIGRPLFRFLKSYVIKRGFLDGKPGLIHALLNATYQFNIVAKLMEKKIVKQNNNKYGSTI